MSRPISKGDVCLIIDGVLKHKSPNVGKTVTVQWRVGEHSKLGVIWQCSGPDLIAFNDDTMSPSGTVDVPAIWLKRIEPPPLPAKTQSLELEKT
jgi:hypothetical protein